jgi:hypothetical protein
LSEIFPGCPTSRSLDCFRKVVLDPVIEACFMVFLFRELDSYVLISLVLLCVAASFYSPAFRCLALCSERGGFSRGSGTRTRVPDNSIRVSERDVVRQGERVSSFLGIGVLPLL